MSGAKATGAGAVLPPKAEECVKVVVRVRPLSQKEIQDGRIAVVDANEGRGEIIVKNPKLDERDAPKSFTFDAVFGPSVTQKLVYDTCAAPVVESVLNGYNGTIFAYGQTGSGKTHTMEGYVDPPTLRGIIPNSFKHIFDRVAISDNQQFLVRASYLEIYNEEIRDLLSKDPRNSLDLKENPETGVYVKDLTSFVVKSAQEIDNVMQAGKKNRSVGATLMNQTSSRSHSIFTIIVECANLGDSKGDNHIRVGKLNLVDLAGSERQSKTGATGDRLREATKINLSLSALGNVISALVDGKSQHIPYRDSKLTRLLQDSLGGNTKTVMCANCGPAEYNYDETISTLRYANRAKNIKNKPKINEDPKDAMLREFQEEIQRLRAQLEAQEKGVVMVDGREVPMGQAQSKEEKVVERIVEVEKVVEKEIRVDLSREERLELEARAEKEKEELRAKARQEMEKLLQEQTKTAEEREALRQKLEKEAADRAALIEQKATLQDRLKAMEEKLIQGGEILDKAAKQEAMLRKAKIELEEQQRNQVTLSRELAEKEEAHLNLEDQYSSLQEEVEVKTKKLRKVWNKFQAANREIQDLQEEFQREREDMLDTIRQLTRQLKLKDTIINNFVPPEEAKKIEKRSKWNEELDSWIISRLEFSGNNIRPRRPVSGVGLRRPESEYARARKAYDKNPRYKYDNIINMELDMPEPTTQSYMGGDMVSNVAQVLSMPLDAEGEEVLTSTGDSGIASPYLHYAPEEAERGASESASGERPKSAVKKTKSSSRPKTGSKTRTSSKLREESGSAEGKRRGSGGVVQEEDEFKAYAEEQYPVARGLVGK